MNTLYLECNSGISGDMTVAALLDLGGDEKVLREGLASLGVSGYHLHIGRVSKSGIAACDFDVQLEGKHPHSHDSSTESTHSQDHGHVPGHGHSHQEDRQHSHNHEHTHLHEHAHGEGGHTHPHDHEHTNTQHHSQEFAVGQGSLHGHGHAHGGHEHRNLDDILALIRASSISPRAKELSERIFRVVAEAEARVHGVPLEQVHFHEVGAVDSIVDIVGAAILVDNLGVNKVICSPLREGTGTVRCQHGVMPVPAPATLEIVRARGIPLVITEIKGEMVTPTGAAIVAALADSFAPLQEARVCKVGYGAGKRNYAETANLLRASLIEETGSSGDTVCELSCNLDDITGEELAYACERLLEAGALDVWTTSIGMKKGRPGYLLSVLSTPALEQELARLMLLHTTTIGVRTDTRRRFVLPREKVKVSTPYGPIDAKASGEGALRRVKPEYDDAARLALEQGVPLRRILHGNTGE